MRTGWSLAISLFPLPHASVSFIYLSPSRSDPDDLYISTLPNILRLNGRCSSYGKHFPAIAIASFSCMIGTRSFSEPIWMKKVESWGIHVLRSPVRMPTANAHCERLIGTIRRECLDYVIPLNASHLRRFLREWVRHYNTGRPHRSLGPGIPDPTQVTSPTSRVPFRVSRVIAKPILGGLHHEYRWANAA